MLPYYRLNILDILNRQNLFTFQLTQNVLKHDLHLSQSGFHRDQPLFSGDLSCSWLTSNNRVLGSVSFING